MKKNLAIMLLLAMVLLLAACGGATATAPEEKTIENVLNSELVEEKSNELFIGEITEIKLDEVNDNIVNITKAGEYMLSGSFEGQIVVNTQKDSKVKLVLSNAEIKNNDCCILVMQADKVILSTEDGSTNSIICGGDFGAGSKVDGAIYSKDDLQLSGHGSLSISCDGGHGAVSKNDIEIKNLDLSIKADKKGIKAGDELNMKSGIVNIEAGTEGIEALIVNIEDGTLNIISGDDGINAAERNSKPLDEPEVNILGGVITICAGGDGIDSNGDINISGGTVTVTEIGGADYQALEADGKCNITGGKQKLL